MYTATDMREISADGQRFGNRLDKINKIILNAATDGELEVNIIRLDEDIEETLKNFGYKVYHVASYESYKYIPGTVVISWRE